jgi:hypothetical protein
VSVGDGAKTESISIEHVGSSRVKAGPKGVWFPSNPSGKFVLFGLEQTTDFGMNRLEDGKGGDGGWDRGNGLWLEEQTELQEQGVGSNWRRKVVVLRIVGCLMWVLDESEVDFFLGRIILEEIEAEACCGRRGDFISQDGGWNG